MFKKRLHLYVSRSSWLAMADEAVPGSGPAAGTHSDACGADWKKVGDALHARFGGGRSVQVVLSSRLCSFIVLPWLSDKYTATAIRTYAMQALAANSGISTATHHVEFDLPEFGRPILAIAYPRGVTETISSGLESSGYLLRSVTASVDPVLRKYARHINADAGLLAFAEDDGVTAVTIEAGVVAQIESLGPEEHGLDELAVWSSRKRLGFANDERMRWLGSTGKPEAFHGVELAAGSAEELASAGHGVLFACRS